MLKKVKKTNGHRKDWSNEFLIGAVVFLLVATAVYKFWVSPMLVQMDCYYQVEKLYENGEYEEAMRWTKRMYRKIQENGGNTSAMQKQKSTLEKKMFVLYAGIHNSDIAQSRFLYRDMDGDGSLECCRIFSNGLKELYTCKDGKIYNLTNDFYNYTCDSDAYIVELIHETHNLFSIVWLNSGGFYYEKFYKVDGTELKEVAEKTVNGAYDGYSDVSWICRALKEIEKGQGYRLSQKLFSVEEYSIEGEMCNKTEYDSYIAQITENERGVNGVTSQLAEWEVEDSQSKKTFDGASAYYGGRASAEEYGEYLHDELYYMYSYDYYNEW